MTASSKTFDPPHPGAVLCDVILILAISLVAAAAHFSIREGRAVLCGDSAQYLDEAEALLIDEKAPDFGFRKPGYALLLAAIGRITGSMSWAAVATNHVLLALVALAAYGLGLNLRSRLTGWVAAVLTVAQLQALHWAERIMSEPLYTCVLSFAVLLFVIGLSRRVMGRWMFAAGVLFAFAWLTRAAVVVVIVAAMICVLWKMRKATRCAWTPCACLLLPVLGAVLVESGLNLAYSDRFRTATGGLGIMLTTRTCYFQGVALPDTEAARACLALLPERSRDEAYVADKLDGCVARCHAIRDCGMDEWEFNDLMARAGVEMIAGDPKSYLSAGLDVFVRHILRQKSHPPLERVPSERRRPIVVHPDAANLRDSQDHWYAYWFLPHRSVAESVDFVSRIRAAAAQRAPFGGSGIGAGLRYGSMVPPVVDALGVLRGLASLWPGFALILCGPLGLNRRTCGFLAAAYMLDALLIAACGSTDVANQRYQCTWLAADTVLAAAILTPAARLAASSIRKRLAGPNASAAGADRTAQPPGRTA